MRAERDAFWMALHGGADVPIRNFGDAFLTGWEAGAQFMYMHEPQKGIGLALAFHRLQATDAANDVASFLYGPGTRLGLDAIQATAQVFYGFRPDGEVRPYFGGGAGLYLLRGTLEDSREFDWDSKLGFNVATGVDRPVTRSTAVGIGGTIHFVFDPQHDEPSMFITIALRLVDL